MSSYIIAGSADSLDTAYCEQIARRIQAKYKNIDFRIVIKHPSEWEEYLQQICRIYGFLNKSNPIIYTYHGKIIGNKDAFIDSTVKYFGLDSQFLNFADLSTRVNVKQADEELKRKNIVKSNFKTLEQKIDITYKKLLKQGLLKHTFKTRDHYLVNGIEYSFCEIAGICPDLKFPHLYEVKIEKQSIEPENIDLMALSMQDQITPEDGGKEAFVTNNQQLNTEAMEKMSEASRTNRLHSSVMSRDGDSKQNKESNQDGQKIEEEFDDVADFNDENMEQYCICELGDMFYLSFEKQKNTFVSAEMIVYYNEALGNGNTIRLYNDGRPVIGHRTLIKQIHYIGEDHAFEKQNESTLKNIGLADPKVAEGEGIEESKQSKQQEQPNQLENSTELKTGAGKKEEEQNSAKIEEFVIQEKSKTQPNIPENLQQILESQQPDDNISEPHSDLNLMSNLNYHTLYIIKPLSQNELRMILYLVKETNAVSCLQFLPENPNPKIKAYNRKYLFENKDSLFPVERFIEKQMEDGELEDVALAAENESSDVIEVKKINGLDFNHFYYAHTSETDEQKLAKVIKFCVNNLLNLEEALNKEIGYNLIITRSYTMIVALAYPYKVYGHNNLYFDGLAFLGYVQTAKVTEAFKTQPSSINNGKAIRKALAHSSGFNLSD